MTSTAAGPAVGALYSDLASVDLTPLWTLTEELLTSTPRPRAIPWLWSAAAMKPLAKRAIGLVPVERGGERRVLSLQNPGLAGRPYAAATLWGALQCLGPHEVAPAHRHSPGAIRFVLEGDGVWTTVDGDACDMHPGDLVLTPSMAWHDHTNSGDGEMYWFDGLDIPLVEALDAVFFEPHPSLSQPQPRPEDHNASERAAGASDRHVPGGVTAVLSPRPSSLLVYRWADTDAALRRLAEDGDDPLVCLEYVDPATGASVLPTLACSLHRVRAGGRSRPERRAGNAVYVVFAGRGSSVIDGQRFEWGPGDMFVVPSWCALEHAADEQADLFVLTDEPVLRALGLSRREVLDGPQAVTSSFSPRQVRP